MSQKTVAQPIVHIEAHTLKQGQVSDLSVHQQTALAYVTLIVLLVMSSTVLLAVNDLLSAFGVLLLAAWVMKALAVRSDRIAEELQSGKAGEF